MSDNTLNIVDTFKRPGDVKVNRVSIHPREGEAGLNISHFMLELDLYEDMFSPTMSGTMVISDSTGMHALLPLVGGESVQIEFETPEVNVKIQKFFTVYKMESKVISDAKTVYILQLISSFAYRDNLVRISRKFKSNAASIVKKLLDDDLELKGGMKLMTKSGEEGKNQVAFISPYWSPIAIINKITSLCQDDNMTLSDGPAANYLFFENNQGLVFMPLSEIFKARKNKGTRYEYTYDNNPGRKDGSRNYSAEMLQLLDLRIDRQFDMLEKLSTGVLKNQVVEFNALNKTVTLHEPYDYVKSFDKKWSSNENMLVKRSVDLGDGKLNIHTSFPEGVDKIDSTINPVKNRIAVALTNSIVMEAEVHGRTDLAVGDQIYINIPAGINATPDTTSHDKLLSGDYVVTAIQHRLNNLNHNMIIRLMSNAYGYEIEKGPSK